MVGMVIKYTKPSLDCIDDEVFVINLYNQFPSPGPRNFVICPLIDGLIR